MKDKRFLIKTAQGQYECDFIEMLKKVKSLQYLNIDFKICYFVANEWVSLLTPISYLVSHTNWG